MKCVFAQIRKDLLEQGLNVPTETGYLPLSLTKGIATFRAYQPDELDSKEFNTIIHWARKKYKVNSVDFEFFNTRREAYANAQKLIDSGIVK